MIRAAKNAPGEWLVWRLIRAGVTKQFSAVHVRERPHPPTPSPSSAIATDGEGEQDIVPLSMRSANGAWGGVRGGAVPTLYYANHSNWWDGYLCMVLARLGVRHNPYLMMEEKNLARYRFFTWAGVYGVDRDDARAALASLDYAASLMQSVSAAKLPIGMFIFPQGTITPNDRRPLRLFSGAARLALQVAATQPVRLVPVAFRYEYLQEQRPEAFMSVGAGLTLDNTRDDHKGSPRQTPRDLNAAMTLALTAELDALRADIIAERLADFTTVLRGKQGIDRAFDRLSSRGRRVSRRLSRETQTT